MAVAFVRRTEGQATSTALNLNIEVSAGTDRALVFAIAYKSNSVITATSVNFNTSESFGVEHRQGTDAANAQVSMWVLTNPTVTTADVALVMPSSVRMVGYAAYFTGVNQSNPFTGNTVDAQGNDAAPTVDITSATDEICVDIMCMVSADPNAVTPDHTLMCDLSETGGGTDTHGSAQRVAGQGTRTMGWTAEDTDDWNIIAAALQIPSVGGTARLLLMSQQMMQQGM